MNASRTGRKHAAKSKFTMESMECRQMLSGDLQPVSGSQASMGGALTAGSPQPLMALLLPAVQSAREAARR